MESKEKFQIVKPKNADLPDWIKKQIPCKNFKKGLCKNHTGCSFFHERYFWTSPKGMKVAGAGVVIYDNTGIWVIQEKIGEKKTYTDVGGMYHYDDGTPFQTVAREAGEETCHLWSITCRQIGRLAKKYPPLILGNKFRDCVYLSFWFSIQEVPDFCFDNDQFNKIRDEFFTGNPTFKENFHTVAIKYLSFDSLTSTEIPLSKRLKKILKSPLITIPSLI